MLNYLKSEYLELLFSHQVCLKGHVLLVCFQNKCSTTVTARKVCEKYGLQTSKDQIRCLINSSINIYIKNISRDIVKFQNICSDVFFKSAFSIIGIPEIETIEVPSILTPDISCLNTVEPIVSTESCDLFSSPGLSTSVSLHPSLSRLRDSKTIWQLENKLNEQSFNLQLKNLQKKNLRLKKQLALSKTELTYQVTILRNQIFDRNSDFEMNC